MGNSFRCRLSDPAHPHTLVDFKDVESKTSSSQLCFACGKRENDEEELPKYCCATCDVEFHNGCYWRPREIRHAYHLQHPLTLINRDIDTVSSDKCDWCKSTLDEEEFYYRCSVCKFTLDSDCIKKDPPLTIANPKCHRHQLFFIPRPLLLPCDACGLVNERDSSYACFQCNYMVHTRCMDLPRIMKITRHPHRLSHTPYLPLSAPPDCRICYKRVDIKYGSYSCNHQEGCCYVAHSKCATDPLVWAGKELEWEPEEEPVEDVDSFKKLSDGFIKYFSHDHPLKYEVHIIALRGPEKLCEACVLPIDSGHFYNCIQCDFALHELCAGLPRKLDHALHMHTLVLATSPAEEYNDMRCSACKRICNGFTYKCYEKCCYSIFIDFRCISMAQYLTHRSHVHPLFMATIYSYEDDGARCNRCKKKCFKARLLCTICEYALCMSCATIPHEVFYKFDEHPLSLCYGEEEEGEEDHTNTYWCEVCEGIISPTEWFYTCNKCCPTIHVECLFGSTSYIKPGFSFDHKSIKVATTRNSKTTRPLCIACRKRCPSSIYFKVYLWSVVATCSINCLEIAIGVYKDKEWYESNPDDRLMGDRYKKYKNLVEAQERWLNKKEEAYKMQGSAALLLLGQG